MYSFLFNQKKSSCFGSINSPKKAENNVLFYIVSFYNRPIVEDTVQSAQHTWQTRFLNVASV